jgi:IS30 family transposase
MDTFEGRKADTRCLLTLYHRPTSFQLALPIKDQTLPSVLYGLSLIGSALGLKEAVRRVFTLVLTDNGSEFSDEEALARAFGERDGECRLYYCDPRRAEQKGGCERNYSEIRKLLPKGKGIRFDLLTRKDASLLMSEVNSEPRGKLAWLSPCDMLVQAFGEDGLHLLDAFGIERVAPGDLDLTPRCLERERAKRGEAPLI